jgi:tartrate-resistant acid phosphatase type 5
MSLIRPTRRELLGAIPLVVGASAFAGPAVAFAQAAQRPLNFLAVGDWGRGGHHNQRAVADRMGTQAQAKQSCVIASTGDNFYTFGVSSTEDPKWRSSFEEVYVHPGLHEIPWHPVLGNHDYGGNVGAQIHYGGAGSRWQMDDHHYARRIATPAGVNVDLFFIDTVMWIGKEGFPFSFLGSEISPDGQRRQAEWLIGALRDSGARFKFVFGHHGIHSIGPHGGEMQMAQLDDVLRQFGVTAYVHGHDHCLFHISHRGMDYICSGGGSQVLATYTGGNAPGCVYNGFCDPAGSDVPFPRWRAFIRDAGFASFDVYPDRVDFDLVGLNTIPGPAHHATLYPK